MRVRRTLRGLAARTAIAVLTATALPPGALLFPGFSLAQDVTAESGSPCLRKLDQPVHSAFGWRFIVRSVEVRKDQLIVRLSFRNNQSQSGLIALVPEEAGATRLVDAATSHEYVVETISGVEAELQKVKRDSFSTAEFTFPYPAGAKEVRFSSIWVTPIMRGAGQKMDIGFLIAVPGQGACGA